MWLQTHRPLWTQLCPKHFPTHCACRKLMTFRRVYICSFQFIFYFLFPSWFYIFFKKLIHTWFQYWVNNWFYSSKPFCSRFSPFRWSKKKKKFSPFLLLFERTFAKLVLSIFAKFITHTWKHQWQLFSWVLTNLDSV